MCCKSQKTKCRACSKPQTYPHVESVRLILDEVRHELRAEVNGEESNSVPLPTGGGSGGGDIKSNVLAVSFDGQTLLSGVIPVEATLVSFSVNGIRYEEGNDFIITGVTNQDILWQSTKFPLKTSFYVVIEYIDAVTT